MTRNWPGPDSGVLSGLYAVMPLQRASTIVLLALAAMLCAGTYTGNHPAETYDGLVLVPDTRLAQAVPEHKRKQT